MKNTFLIFLLILFTCPTFPRQIHKHYFFISKDEKKKIMDGKWYGIFSDKIKKINSPQFESVSGGDGFQVTFKKSIIYGFSDMPEIKPGKIKSVSKLTCKNVGYDLDMDCFAKIKGKKIYIYKKNEKTDEMTGLSSYEVSIKYDKKTIKVGRVAGEKFFVADLNRDSYPDVIISHETHSCGGGKIEIFLSQKDKTLKKVHENQIGCL